MHKDKIHIFSPVFEIIKKYLEKNDFNENFHKLINLFDIAYINNYNMKNNFKIEKDKTNFDSYSEALSIGLLYPFNSPDPMYLNLEGIVLNKNELNENIIIDLILNYLKLNKLFIHNDYLYSKIENTLISYKRIGSVKEILFDQFETNIIPFFTENFPCQFDGFDFYYLIKTYKNKMESNIDKIKNISTNKITLNFSFLEFTDGIYDIQNNNFIFKNNFINSSNTCTIKYYKQAYN
jgi:hypothetical protein